MYYLYLYRLNIDLYDAQCT